MHSFQGACDIFHMFSTSIVDNDHYSKYQKLQKYWFASKREMGDVLSYLAYFQCVFSRWFLGINSPLTNYCHGGVIPICMIEGIVSQKYNAWKI